MSTCPRCKGFLGEGHKCPRHPGRMLAETAALAAVGAFIALLAVAVVQPIGSASNLEAIAVVTGAVIGIIVRRLLRH